MNNFLEHMLNKIGIDVNHLTKKFLNKKELNKLDKVLKTEKDLDKLIYIKEHGDNLEEFTYFLNCHKNDIKSILKGVSVDEIKVNLYTSFAIPGGHDTFRFDLSKFKKLYIPENKELKLYRIGRNGECSGNLGCSWAKSIDGLNAYCESSGLDKSRLKSRPIFAITINDTQVLFAGNKIECELVLKPSFKYKTLDNIDINLLKENSKMKK